MHKLGVGPAIVVDGRQVTADTSGPRAGSCSAEAAIRPSRRGHCRTAHASGGREGCPFLRTHGPASHWHSRGRRFHHTSAGPSVSRIAPWYYIGYYDLVTRAKHKRILESMFKKPTPAGIRWKGIASMLKAAGVEVSQRSSSRVLLKMGADRIVIHRPRPETRTGRATVQDVAAFLKSIGVDP